MLFPEPFSDKDMNFKMYISSLSIFVHETEQLVPLNWNYTLIYRAASAS